jgi:Domain of unknown function (DUF5076)
MNALRHPPDAELHEDSHELLRVWVVGQELQVVLASGAWQDEPGEWGRLLAESVCHIADAIGKDSGKDRDKIYRTIAESIMYHLQHPPDDLRGDFIQ